MKKLGIVFTILLFCMSLNLFAEEPPIESGGWYWEDGITLNGKWFYYVSESYKEQDGWAYIEGFGKIHYWLYDTYTYWDGYGEKILEKYVPSWIESMGYVIDFDHIKVISPDNDLASSVKALMAQRRCDLGVSLITSVENPYVVINNYDRDGRIYWTIIIPLIK